MGFESSDVNHCFQFSRQTGKLAYENGMAYEYEMYSFGKLTFQLGIKSAAGTHNMASPTVCCNLCRGNLLLSPHSLVTYRLRVEGRSGG